jgi:uncharacterized membrane protein YeaQ/YmgE (transglycosylase-associated protein family)
VSRGDAGRLGTGRLPRSSLRGSSWARRDVASSSERRTVMNLIVAVIIGGIIGWLASLIMKTNAQMGLLANIVVGVVGSLLGHWAAAGLGIATAGSLASWLVSLVGAVVLIAILRALGVFK